MPVRRALGPRDAWLERELASLPSVQRIDPRDRLTPYQRDVFDHPSRFKALPWGRRTGKTDVADTRHLIGLLDKPESEWLFMGLTTESARANMWRPLQRIDRKYGRPLKFDNSKMTVTCPRTEAVLQVRGSETLRDLEKPRGNGYAGITLDECGAWRPHYLEYALDEVIGPAMMDDPESELWMLGTAGRLPVGIWYEISTGLRPGWYITRKTAWDNPHLDADTFVFGPCRQCIAKPDPADVRQFRYFDGSQRMGCVHSELARKNWTIDSSAFQREYLAIWTVDEANLVYRFAQERNVIPCLPELVAGDSWVCALGLDFGVTHATACYTLVWPKRYGRAVYVVRGFSAPGLAASDLAAMLKTEYDRCKTEFGEVKYIVGDPGGGGKVYWAEWNKRHPNIAWAMAQKSDKRGALDHISDALANASGAGGVQDHRGLLSLSGNTVLHRQWQTLQWDEDRKDIAEGQDDDDADAVMYGWRFSPAFRNAAAPPKAEKRVLLPWEHGLARKESNLEKAFRGHVRGRR